MECSYVDALHTYTYSIMLLLHYSTFCVFWSPIIKYQIDNLYLMSKPQSNSRWLTYLPYLCKITDWICGLNKASILYGIKNQNRLYHSYMHLHI